MEPDAAAVRGMLGYVLLAPGTRAGSGRRTAPSLARAPGDARIHVNLGNALPKRSVGWTRLSQKYTIALQLENGPTVRNC